MAQVAPARRFRNLSARSAPQPITAIQRFNFHGDMLDVATDEKGEHFVVLARLCEPLGLDVQTQWRKLEGQSWAGVAKIATPSAGGFQETCCLNIRSVAGWLFTINAGKVKPHLRDKLALYQRECADVLADHFLGRRAATADLTSLRDSLRADLSAEFAPVLSRLAALEAHTATVASNTGPVIGTAAAEVRILAPLREAARIRVRAVGNEAAFASQRAKLEDALRATLGFSRSGGRSWAMFPTARLGDATDEVTAILKDARDLAGASKPKPVQLALVGNTNASKRTG